MRPCRNGREGRKYGVNWEHTILQEVRSDYIEGGVPREHVVVTIGEWITLLTGVCLCTWELCHYIGKSPHKVHSR